MADLVYQFHVLLHGVEPAVWRRLRVCSNTSLAELHGIVQAAFGWSDVRRHQFLIRGKRYGGAQTVVLSERAELARFCFRPKERFLYHYGLADEWRHQIRFEGTAVLGEGLASTVCIGGARAGPSDECTGPSDYADRLSRQSGDAPWVERFYVADVLARLAHARPGETVRETVGDVDVFALAVQRLGAHDRFNPDRFDRHEVNRRLRAYANGDERWREPDDDDDNNLRDDRRP